MPTETVLECPKCSRTGLVRLYSDKDIFECLYCHYRDDLSDVEGQGNFLIPLLVAVVLVLVLLGI